MEQDWLGYSCFGFEQRIRAADRDTAEMRSSYAIHIFERDTAASFGVQVALDIEELKASAVHVEHGLTSLEVVNAVNGLDHEFDQVGVARFSNERRDIDVADTN